LTNESEIGYYNEGIIYIEIGYALYLSGMYFPVKTGISLIQAGDIHLSGWVSLTFEQGIFSI
jgi:hypothetical protein